MYCIIIYHILISLLIVCFVMYFALCCLYGFSLSHVYPSFYCVRVSTTISITNVFPNTLFTYILKCDYHVCLLVRIVAIMYFLSLSLSCQLQIDRNTPKWQIYNENLLTYCVWALVIGCKLNLFVQFIFIIRGKKITNNTSSTPFCCLLCVRRLLCWRCCAALCAVALHHASIRRISNFRLFLLFITGTSNHTKGETETGLVLLKIGQKTSVGAGFLPLHRPF